MKKSCEASDQARTCQLCRKEHWANLRVVCRAVGISDSVYQYQPDTRRNDHVILTLQEAVEQYPAYGFNKLFKIGHNWNHKRVYRLYYEINLNKRRRGKKRLPTRCPEPLSAPTTANDCWSMDFMSDSLFCGRRFRIFNLLDDFNREALAIEIDLSLPAKRVIRVLERVVAWRGYPKKLRMDNGSEFTSTVLAEWTEAHHIQLEFIQPGKPTQNSYVERFNRTYRDEILNMYVFKSLTEVRKLTENWIREYNAERPH